MLSATEFDVLAGARDQLLRAPRGAKAAIIDRVARTLGCSSQTAYRKLNQAGLDTQRKRRSDAGESLLNDADLRLVAGVLAASLNQKGQRMPVRTALDMLRASGQLGADVSESTVSRQLYAHRMHPEQLALPTASVQMVSLHPNHVWQVDSTTGAYYYLPGGRLRWMPEDQFYKNKVDNLVKASSDLLTRYAATDHTSHAFKARYYLGGETAENLLDFVTWVMWKQTAGPMHGVPLMLVMDPGAANKGQLLRNFCKAVGVQLEHHAPGAARVTGSVEKTHDIVRMHFETRFRFTDPRDVTLDTLNERIEQWAASHCATRIHTRHGRTRYGAWMAILPEQLRVPASLEALREAAVREPETRRVNNDRTVSFNAKTYDLSQVPGVVAGLKVTLQVNVFRAPAIDVQFICPDTGAESWHVVEPAQTTEWGFRVDGPVWGQDMRSAANSTVDNNRNALTKQAYKVGDGLPTLEEAAKARKAHAQAYAGIVDPMADVKATPVPAYLPRRATELALPARQVESRRLSTFDACTELRHKLGAAYGPQVRDHVLATYADGVPEDQLDAIAAQFRPDAAPAAGPAALRVVGGDL
ncbi:MAG: hypothetical protein RL375_3399 [Pseudomonadota bacterium]